jgi:hypothetical protein
VFPSDVLGGGQTSFHKKLKPGDSVSWQRFGEVGKQEAVFPSKIEIRINIFN